MGSIPEYRRTTFASPNVDFGAINRAQSIGQNIANVGRIVEQVSVQNERIKKEQEKLQAQEYATTKSLDLEENYSQLFNQFEQENKANPVGATEKFKEKLKEIKPKMFEDAPNEEAKRRVELISLGLDRKYLDQSRKWELKTQIQNTGLQTQSNLEKLQTRSYTEGFGTLETRLKEVNVVAAPLLNVADNVTGQETITRGKRAVAYGAFEGAIEKGDLVSVEQMLATKQYDDILGKERLQDVHMKLERKRQSLLSSQKKALANKFKNPYKYLNDIGEQVKPVDFNGDITSQLEDRMNFQDSMNTKHDMNTPLLAPDEVLQVQALFDRGTIDEKAVVLNGLSEKIPQEAFERFATQVFKKSPALGAAMGVAEDDPQTAKDIIFGNELIKNRAYKVNKKDISDYYDTKMGLAIPDPDLRGQLKEAVITLYTAKAYKEQKDPESFASDDIDEVINRMVGPVVSINKVKTLSFKDKEGNFLDEDKFEDTIEDLTPERIQETHGDIPRDLKGEPIKWDDFEDYGSLEAVGPGKYKIIININGTNEYTLDKNKRPFILDMNNVIDKYGVTPGLLERILR